MRSKGFGEKRSYTYQQTDAAQKVGHDPHGAELQKDPRL
jgi:hypothetical protein